ncbi:MAG: hypothetical protein GY906_34550 [bacterium]|nr:hypothetical protein [bacterium]
MTSRQLRRFDRRGCYRIHVLVLGFVLGLGCSPASETTTAEPYLGQTPPGIEPEVFAPGLISFGTHEHHLVISPDGDEMFYVVADNRRRHHIILQVTREDGAWLNPEVASFSGTYSDFAPTFTPDGTSLLFCSNRPIPPATETSTDFNIWRAEKSGGAWLEPEVLPAPVNDESNEYNPTVALDGTMYFQDHDESGVDIYRTRLQNGNYTSPEKLGSAINSPATEIGPWVTPDETLLIFASDREGGLGSMDLYSCAGDGKGNWEDAVNLGPPINTPSADAIMTMSPDGRYLFYLSFAGLAADALVGKSYPEVLQLLQSLRNGDGTLYWVSSEVLSP